MIQNIFISCNRFIISIFTLRQVLVTIYHLILYESSFLLSQISVNILLEISNLCGLLTNFQSRNMRKAAINVLLVFFHRFSNLGTAVCFLCKRRINCIQNSLNNQRKLVQLFFIVQLFFTVLPKKFKNTKKYFYIQGIAYK